MESSIILLSGGLDSTLSLALTARSIRPALAITFDYGQRAAPREIIAAKTISEHFCIPHRVIDLPWLKAITATSLVNRNQTLPDLATSNLDDMAAATASAKAVWVPNRNGLFINMAGSFAESMNAEWIIVGFNREEAATFPDNTTDFIEAISNSLSWSTLSKPRVMSPVAEMNKTEMIAKAIEIGLDLSLLWPCYEAGETWCGQCESCRRFDRAMKHNHR